MKFSVPSQVSAPDPVVSWPVSVIWVVGTTTAGRVVPGRAGLRAELWIALVLAALALLCVEWVTYHRRVTG